MKRCERSGLDLSGWRRSEVHAAHAAVATGIAAAFSGLSATTASVVRNSAAIDAAFCSAERTTLVGSGMPAASMSPYSPVAALRP
jgi:hypothetical protein